MILSKIYTITLTIEKVADIYNPDFESVIMAEFNNRYKGRCLYGSYIVSGDELIQHGLIMSDITGNYVNISIEVKCTVINYNVTEVVIAKISTITKGQIYLTNDHAIIALNSSESTKFYKLGDIVPVIVAQIQYPVLKDKININAQVFRLLPDASKFYINDSGSVNEEIVENLLDEIAEIEGQLNSLEKQNRGKYNYFLKFLRKNTQGKSIYKIRDIQEGEVIYRTSAMYYSPLYAVSQPDETAIKISKKSAVELLLGQYKLELINLLALLNIEDPAKISYIFDLYRKDEK